MERHLLITTVRVIVKQYMFLQNTERLLNNPTFDVNQTE